MHRSSRRAIVVLMGSLPLGAADVQAERACACAPVLELTPKQAGQLTLAAMKLLARNRRRPTSSAPAGTRAQAGAGRQQTSHDISDWGRSLAQRSLRPGHPLGAAQESP